MTPNRHFKDAIYEQFARLGKAVSSPRRLELLDLLCQGPRTVEVLAGEAGLSVANTSQHLQLLRASRLVETEKRGQYVTYRVADAAVCDLFFAMRNLAGRRLAEVEWITSDFLAGRQADLEDLEPVDREALIARVREGSVTVLDVRPVEEYTAGHIRGALSVPLDELEARLAELPRTREIVAYCRGPYCVLAVEAVERLRARGFRAVRLREGVYDWRARGFSLATGTAP